MCSSSETYLKRKVLVKTYHTIINIVYSNLAFYELEFEIKGEMYQLPDQLIFAKLNWCLLANERFFFLISD